MNSFVKNIGNYMDKINSLKDYTIEVLMDEINQRDIEARTKVNELCTQYYACEEDPHKAYEISQKAYTFLDSIKPLYLWLDAILQDGDNITILNQFRSAYDSLVHINTQYEENKTSHKN